MKTIAFFTLYLIGMLVCQIYTMLRSQQKDKWDITYMAISLFSWAGLLIIWLIFKIKRQLHSKP